MELTNQEKAKILAIVNNPQLSFAETKQKIADICPFFNEEQVNALARVICEEIDQTKRGKLSGITDLEGKKWKVR